MQPLAVYCRFQTYRFVFSIRSAQVTDPMPECVCTRVQYIWLNAYRYMYISSVHRRRPPNHRHAPPEASWWRRQIWVLPGMWRWMVWGRGCISQSSPRQWEQGQEGAPVNHTGDGRCPIKPQTCRRDSHEQLLERLVERPRPLADFKTNPPGGSP